MKRLRVAVTILVLAVGLAACVSSPSKPATLPPDAAEASAKLDRYIDQRFAATAADTAELVAYFEAHGQDATAVEALLRGQRASYPVLAWTPGTLSSANPIECFHVDYASVYYAYVPTTRVASKASPVLVVGHGGNSSMSATYARETALSYLKAYRPLADKLGAVLVAPASERGWSPIGDSLIISTLSDLQRRLWIDADRIYLTGQSMGGHLAWRSAMNYTDWFAGFAPMSGGYPQWADDATLSNLWDTVGYFTWGATEPYDLDKTNVKLEAFLTANRFAWTGKQVAGSHPIASGEFTAIAALFSTATRQQYAKTAYFRGTGAMQYTGNWNIEGWPVHTIRTDRPLKYNVHRFLRITPRSEADAGVIEIKAQVQANNVIELRTRNARHITVMLHPAMGLDLDAPITIRVNGVVAFADVVERDLGRMLDMVREFDDRGRIFQAFVELDITTDGDVGPAWAP